MSKNKIQDSLYRRSDQFASSESVVIIVIVRCPVKEGDHPVIVVHLLLVVQPVRLTLSAPVSLQVDLEAALHLVKENLYCELDLSQSHICDRVPRALALGTCLRGDRDVDDPIHVHVYAGVTSTRWFIKRTVVVSLTARVALQSEEVAVLTDLLQAVLLEVTDEVGPAAGPVLATLALDTLAGLAGAVWTVLVTATRGVLNTWTDILTHIEGKCEL